MSNDGYTEEDDLLFLTIGTLTGNSFPVNIFSSDTVFDLKAQIESIQGIPCSNQILVYKENSLTCNSATLAECNVRSGAYIQLLVHMAGGHPPPLKTSHQVKCDQPVLFLLCREKDDFYVLELRVNSPKQLKNLKDSYLSNLEGPLPFSVLSDVSMNNLLKGEVDNLRPSSSSSVASLHSDQSSLSGILSIPSSIQSSRSTTPTLPLLSPKKPQSASITRSPKRYRNNRPATTISITPIRPLSKTICAGDRAVSQSKRNVRYMQPVRVTDGTLKSEVSAQRPPYSMAQEVCDETTFSANPPVSLPHISPLIPIPNVVSSGQAKHCKVCQKRLGLTKEFKCKCGSFFCGSHRYSDRHNCTFNYKEAGKVTIARENPAIARPKIEKI
jgi:hypothetical protein